MADRVYPTAKPTPPPPTAAVNGGENPKFPPTKGQLYTPATRPMYRPGGPQKHRRERRRSCCCSCFLWTFLLLFILAVLIAIAGAAVYVIYRPQRPTFSVSSLQLAQFNLTGAALAARFNFTVAARNPNKKIVYFYDPISVSVFSSDVKIGDGSFPAFEHRTKNTTTLRAVVSHSGSGSDLETLQSDLKKNKNSLPVKLQLDTKVKAKIGGLKTKKVAIRVNCEGIKVAIPTGKTPTTATTSNVKCKVDLRIKIWKWTF